MIGKRIITLLLVVCMTASICSCKKQEEVTEEETGEFHPEQNTETLHGEYEEINLVAPRKEREITVLPDKEKASFFEASGYKTAKIYGQQISLLAPEEADMVAIDNFNLIFTEKDGTKYYLHRVYSTNYTDTVNFYQYVPDVIKKIPITLDDKICNIVVHSFGKELPLETLGGEGTDVITDKPSLTICEENSYHTINQNCAASYMVLHDGRAFIVLGLSEMKKAEEMAEVTRKMAETIMPYTPSKNADEIEFGNTTVAGEGLLMSLPLGWETETADGFTLLSPKDKSSLYGGVTVYITSDANKICCEDALQLAEGISDIYVGRVMGKDTKYVCERSVSDFDYIVIADSVQGYFFDIQETVYPQTADDAAKIPQRGNVLKSYRYTYTDKKGIPYLVGIEYDDISADIAYAFGRKLINTIRVGGK